MFRVARVADGQDHHNTLVLRRIVIRLHDCFGAKMPNVKYALEYAGGLIEGTADSDGFVYLGLTNDSDRCTIRWDPAIVPGQPERTFYYEQELFLELFDGESQESARQQLHNLGYGSDLESQHNLSDFQSHYGLEVTGALDGPTKGKLKKICDDILDEQSELPAAGVPDAPADDQRT